MLERGKGSFRKHDKDASGKCVSINQIISAQPDLTPEMAGFLTSLRIWAATIFVDHYLGYVHVTLMCNLTLNKTLLAKSSFEWHANKDGFTIKSYQPENGRFADSGFQQAIKDCNQKITYCAVGSHHQNGIIEQRINKLTLISWMLLLHAKCHWPDYVCENIHSWIPLSGDLVFSHQQGIYGFKSPKRGLKISSRELSLFSILII